MDVELGMRTYRDIKSRNLRLGGDAMANLLSLVSGLGEIGNGHVGPSRDEVTPPHNLKYAIEVFSDMISEGMKVTEAGYTAMIRCYCINHRREEALALYKKRYEDGVHLNCNGDAGAKETEGEAAAEASVEGEEEPKEETRDKSLDKYWVTKTKDTPGMTRSTPKLRTFYPLMFQFAQAPQRDLSTCMYLWTQMTDVHHLFPSEREFVIMFQLLLDMRVSSALAAPTANTPVAERVLLTDTDLGKYVGKCTYSVSDVESAFHYLLDLFNDHMGAFHLRRLNTVYIPEGEGESSGKATNGSSNHTGAIIGVTVMSKWFEAIKKPTGEDAFSIHPCASVVSKHGKLDIQQSSTSTCTTATDASTAVTACGRDSDFLLRSVDITGPIKDLLLGQITSQLTMSVRKTTSNKPANNKLKHVSVSQPAEGTGAVGPKPANDRRKQNDWGSFMVWLDTQLKLRETANLTNQQSISQQLTDAPPLHSLPSELNIPPYYTIVLDGANIGYYKMNYAGAPAHVDYFQIHMVVMYLLSVGHYPLIVLHARHTFNNNLPAYSSENGSKIRNLLNFWKAHNILFITPPGSNDDWYWLYASVKLNLQVITNDEMRDHLFKMLNLRYFTQWKERHQIHFNFGRWIRAAKQTQMYKLVLDFISSSPQMKSDPVFLSMTVEVPMRYSCGGGKRLRDDTATDTATATDTDTDTATAGCVSNDTPDAEAKLSIKKTKLNVEDEGSASISMYGGVSGVGDSDTDEDDSDNSDDHLNSFPPSRFVDLKTPALYSLRNQIDCSKKCYYFPIIPEQQEEEAEAEAEVDNGGKAGAEISTEERKHTAHVVKPIDLREVDLDEVRWLCCIANI